MKPHTKKFLAAVVLMSTFSLGAFAAKYKVNTSGKVTSPSGTHQNSSVLSTQPEFYQNYTSQNYIETKQILAKKIGTIDIVMDYSGSMSYWINEAKKSMSAIVSQLPSGTSVGFRVFGHNGGYNPYSPIIARVKSITKTSGGSYKVNASTPSYLGNTSGGCRATEQIVKIAQNDATTLLNGMNSVSIGGSTPLTLALTRAVEEDFAAMAANYPKKIILITDGGENCGGDPCAFADNLMKKRKDITVDVVLVSSNSTALKCLSDTTGGNFYTPKDVSSFAASIYESMTNTPKQSPSTNQPSAPEQQYEYVDN